MIGPAHALKRELYDVFSPETDGNLKRVQPYEANPALLKSIQ